MTQSTVKVPKVSSVDQIHPTVLTVIQRLYSTQQKHTKYTQINTNKSMHSEMSPV